MSRTSAPTISPLIVRSRQDTTVRRRRTHVLVPDARPCVGSRRPYCGSVVARLLMPRLSPMSNASFDSRHQRSKGPGGGAPAGQVLHMSPSSSTGSAPPMATANCGYSRWKSALYRSTISSGTAGVSSKRIFLPPICHIFSFSSFVIGKLAPPPVRTKKAWSRAAALCDVARPTCRSVRLPGLFLPALRLRFALGRRAFFRRCGSRRYGSHRILRRPAATLHGSLQDFNCTVQLVPLLNQESWDSGGVHYACNR